MKTWISMEANHCWFQKRKNKIWKETELRVGYEQCDFYLDFYEEKKVKIK